MIIIFCGVSRCSGGTTTVSAHWNNGFVVVGCCWSGSSSTNGRCDTPVIVVVWLMGRPRMRGGFDVVLSGFRTAIVQ